MLKRKLDSSATNSNHPAPNISRPDPKIYPSKEFTRASYIEANMDPIFRMIPNHKKVGHALFLSIDNETQIYQYGMPEGPDIPYDPTKVIVPEMRPLENFYLNKNYGTERFEACSPGGTRYSSRESIDMQITQDGLSYEGQLLFFAPIPQKDDPYPTDFWGGTKPIDLFKNNLSDETLKEIKEIKPVIKGGQLVEVHTFDVLQRLGAKREGDQKEVLGQSGVEEVEGFYSEREGQFTPLAKKKLLTMHTVAYQGAGMPGHERAEICHLQSYKTCPLDMNPQTIENVIVGPKWINSRMMLQEDLLKLYATFRPLSKRFSYVTAKPILDSEIAESIDHFVSVEENGIKVTTHRISYTLSRHPKHTRRSDFAQFFLVTMALTNARPPLRVDKVDYIHLELEPGLWERMGKPIPSELQYKKHQVHELLPKRQARSSTARPLSAKDQEKFASSMYYVNPKDTGDQDELTEVDEPNPTPKRQKMNNSPSPYQNMLVRINASTPVTPHLPWIKSQNLSTSGIGVIIDANEGLILTCGQLASTHSTVELNFPQSKDKFIAKVLAHRSDSNLTTLKVDHPQFLAKAKAFVFGDYTRNNPAVKIVELDPEDEKIQTTEGQITSSQISDEAYPLGKNLSGSLNKHLDSDNSGAPILDQNGNLLGLASQSGFIPLPVISQFMVSNSGIPELPISVKRLNSAEKHRFKIKDGYQGILITHVDTLALHSGLQPNDFIYEVDGVKLNSDGTVKVPELNAPVHFSWLYKRKQLGQNMSLSILRNGEEKKITVPLVHTKHELKLIGHKPAHNHDFIIRNGLLIEEVTHEVIARHNLDLHHHHFLYHPKSHSQEKLFAITDIYEHRLTEGHPSPSSLILLESINNIPADTLDNIILGFNQKKSGTHSIKTKGQDQNLILYVASPQDENEIITKYKLEPTCSDKSKIIAPQPLPAAVKPPKNSVGNKIIVEVDDPKKARSTSRPATALFKAKNQVSTPAASAPTLPSRPLFLKK